MRKHFVLNGFAVLSIVAGASALAEDTAGFYAGIGIGQATTKLDDDGGIGFDANDLAFKVYGGYSFNANFAVEASYFDGGKPDENGSFGAATVNVEAEPYGLDLSVLGRVPLNESFALFGKLGYARFKTDTTARVNGAVVARGSGTENDLSYGVGATYSLPFNPAFQLRAEYDALNVDDGDFGMFLISGLYKF